MIQALRQGLDIIKTYDADAPVVSHAYRILVPAVLSSSVSGPDQTTLSGLGWLVDAQYDCYYFPAKTLTDVKDVTGEGEGDPPPVSPVLPGGA